jgi:hypothetical protein
MNERIEELAEFHSINVDVMQAIYDDITLLIVRECIRHFNEDYQRDFDTLWREDLTNSIKNHFGV